MKKIFATLLVSLVTCVSVSAQNQGDFAVVGGIGIYSNTSTILGAGAAVRYNATDRFRVEPGVMFLLKKGCSVDIHVDAHYVMPISDRWNIYPLAGLAVNDIGRWAVGINLGGGVDYSLTDNGSVVCNLKWNPLFDKVRSNPVVFNVGYSYKF